MFLPLREGKEKKNKEIFMITKARKGFFVEGEFSNDILNNGARFYHDVQGLLSWKRGGWFSGLQNAES